MDKEDMLDCPKFKPFVLPTQRTLKVKKAKYSTSLDPRGYIPVYEYVINGQPIMWDRESGYVYFTGIWKSLGNSKADIVKMVDSNPELKVKKIRGGYLKIQGTWLPYEYAHILCKRTAWNIRKELSALFGPCFSNDALEPNHPEYGYLSLDNGQKTFKKTKANCTLVTKQPRTYKRKTPYEKLNSMSKLKKNKEKKQEPTFSKKTIKKIMKKNSMLDREGKDTSNKIQYNGKINIIKSPFTITPDTTPSPNLTVLPTATYLPSIEDEIRWKEYCLLSPIHSDLSYSSELNIMPMYSPLENGETWLNLTSPPLSEFSSSTQITNIEKSLVEKDIIDTIHATILLQLLSQDDGTRPFRPAHPDSIPTKVLVGRQEFNISLNH